MKLFFISLISKKFFKSSISIYLLSIGLFGVIFIVFIFGKGLYEIHNALNITQYKDLNHRLIAANHRIKALEEEKRRLNQLLGDLNKLQNREEELFLTHFIEKDFRLNQSPFPSTEYEQSRRRIRQSVDDLWHYLSQRLNESEMHFVNELRYNLLIDFNVLDKRDNQWRGRSLKSLSDFIQQKIQVLQNPIHCKSAKKLICDLDKSCGFGCQMHYTVNCFVAAMALNRTLVVKSLSSDRSYDVWKQLFQPMSWTCLEWSGDNETKWSDDHNVHNYQVLYYSIAYDYKPRPYFSPQNIPKQISHQLIRLSDKPFVWFIGQLLKYLMRLSDRVQTFMNEFKKKIRFNHPIVGIHVRRTDKLIVEAKYHSIDEYMHFVEDFYNKIDFTNERKGVNKTVERLVYLATDEPLVWKTEIQKYIERGYVFTGNLNFSRIANPSKRNGFESYQSVAIDLLLLSECDFIVCTFSSNICRMAFELMQTQESGTDLWNAYHSLDNNYYFDGQVFDAKLAIMKHKAHNESEISFKVGDILLVNDNGLNKFNEYNFGIHNRTKKSGFYPRFKVTDFLLTQRFAIFGDLNF